tara:strand:+ start:78 stop:458 length:381 start_codon:yes stop_codon:yes gene_type:complete
MRNLLLLILTIFVLGCATGSSIVTGKIRPAVNPSEVRIYLDPPPQYETIGIVEAASAVEFSSQAAQDRTIAELKTQAAKIGANGIILIISTEKTSDTVDFYSRGLFVAGRGEIKTAKGKAIFVEQE